MNSSRSSLVDHNVLKQQEEPDRKSGLPSPMEKAKDSIQLFMEEHD